MPLILVSRDAGVVPDNVVAELNQYLVEVVTEELSLKNTPDGKLEPSEIEVFVRDVRHGLDFGYVPLGINIFANDFPERRENLVDVRQKAIEAHIRTFLLVCERRGLLAVNVVGEKKAFVWIFLGYGSFGFL